MHHSKLLQTENSLMFHSVKEEKDHLTIWKCLTLSWLSLKSLLCYSSPSATLTIWTSFPAEKFLRAVLTVSDSRKYFPLNLKPVILRLFPFGSEDTQDSFSHCYPSNLSQVIGCISLVISAVISKKHNGCIRTQCPLKKRIEEKQKTSNRHLISSFRRDRSGRSEKIKYIIIFHAFQWESNYSYCY